MSDELHVSTGNPENSGKDVLEITPDGKRRLHVGGAKSQVKPNNEPCPGPTGNTCGQIGPDTKPNPNGSSAPEINATEKEKSAWDRWGSAVTHGVLDVVGLIPVFGEAADGANALIYLAEGDTINAAISAAAMVPGLGMAATGAKLGTKAVGAVAEGAVKKGGREAAEQVGKKEAKEEGAETAAEQGAKKEGGGNDRRNNKNTGKKGKCGEKLAKQDLMDEGFDEVIEVQNNSGHGVDLIGRNSQTGEVKSWEVKTTDGTSAPSLSKDQASMGGEKYTNDRLGKAAAGKGNYGKVPEAMENAEKALDWMKKAKDTGKPVTYEKREVFIDDISKGCAKNPNKPSQSKPWPAKK